MENLYLQKPSTRRGCLRTAVIAFVILALALALGWWLHGRRVKPPEPPGAETPGEIIPAEPENRVTAPAGEDRRRQDDSDPQRIETDSQLLNAARQLKENDRLLKARETAFRLLSESSDPRARKAAEEILGEVHVELVFSPRPMPEKFDYRVKSGDSLSRLATRFGTTADLIRRGNNIRGSMIRVGDFLRILQGEFSLLVSKEDNTMEVRLNDRFFKRYPVGTGRYGSTPTGDFKITEKIENPPWWNEGRVIPFGDTNNVLGTRWMALESEDDPSLRGYGIHGTWEPETIGHQSSEGCIRMSNEDVEELFILLPRGTTTKITD